MKKIGKKERKILDMELTQALKGADDLFWAIAGGETKDELMTRADNLTKVLLQMTMRHATKKKPETSKEEIDRLIKEADESIGLFYHEYDDIYIPF